MKDDKLIHLESKNIPIGTPLACRSITPSLTSRESDSVAERVDLSVQTELYPAEVDQQVARPEQLRKVSVESVRVFVLDARGTPLMPCEPRKARVLLKDGKAVVIKSRPFFTIKLTKHVGGTVQPIKLGIDPGYEFIGFALVGLYCYLLGQIRLDNKMSERMATRAMYRRGRRNRKRYRKPRFSNRASHKNKDLPPSVQRRLGRHAWIVTKLKSICPISEVIIERNSFDIQKLNSPEIQGKGYQQGALYKSNLRNYLFSREHGICQYCGKKIDKGERIEMHHIIQRKDGGTDKPNNFALLHDKCHRKMHDRNDFSKLKENKQYKAETNMNTVCKRLFDMFPDAIETFGYETQTNRKSLGLPKEHYLDAFVIAGGTVQKLPEPLKLKEFRKNNRSLQVQKPGKQIAIRYKRYPIRPGDLVWVGKKRYVSKGTHNLGKSIWIMKDGKKISISTSRITKVYHFGTIGYDM